MPLTQQTYQRVAVEDPEGQGELHRGRLREKPAMSFAHNETMTEIGFLLRARLDPDHFLVRINTGRVKQADEVYYIPDVYAVPRFRLQTEQASALETYEGPLPLVVEVWSPLTGGYDVDKIIPEYRGRHDLEIWRVHPGERKSTVWRRSKDGRYTERVVRAGAIEPIGLPGVAIRVEDVFARL